MLDRDHARRDPALSGAYTQSASKFASTTQPGHGFRVVRRGSVDKDFAAAVAVSALAVDPAVAVA